MALALALLLLLVASPAWGAVAFDVGAALFHGTGCTDCAATATITPSAGSNRALFIGVVHANNTGVTVSSVTDNQGGSYAKCAGVTGVTTNARVEIWVAVNPATAATTVTVHWSGAIANQSEFGGIVLNGVDQTTPCQNAVNKQQASGTPITQNVNSAAGNMVTDIACNGTTNPTGSTMTRAWAGAVDSSGSCVSASGGYRTGAGASTADTWNVTSGDSSMLVSVDVPAAGGGGGAPKILLPYPSPLAPGPTY